MPALITINPLSYFFEFIKNINIFILFVILITQLISGCSSTPVSNQKISTNKQDAYERLLTEHRVYKEDRNKCVLVELKNNSSATFIQNNILLEPITLPNRKDLLTSKKLLNEYEWAIFSTYWSSIENCFQKLNYFQRSFPTMYDVYIKITEKEKALTEELRLRNINVGEYNQARLLLSQDERKSIDSLFLFYIKEVEIEKLSNQKINLYNNQKSLNPNSTDNKAGNAVLSTVLCAIVTKGNTAGCAAGAFDSNTTSQEGQLKKQSIEIERLKTNQMIEKSNQELKNREIEYQKSKEALDKWKPGQRGVR